MKPKPCEFIPIYGMHKYFKRYFEGLRRGYDESVIAIYMEMYHIVLTILLFLFAFLIFKQYSL